MHLKKHYQYLEKLIHVLQMLEQEGVQIFKTFPLQHGKEF